MSKRTTTSEQAVRAKLAVRADILRGVTGCLISYLPAAAGYRLFQAQGPYWIYPAGFIFTLICILLGRYGGAVRGRSLASLGGLGSMSGLVLASSLLPVAAVGLVILLVLNVTQGAAYVTWFEAFSRAVPGGSLSYFMFLKLMFFSLVALHLWLRQRYLLAGCAVLFPPVLIAATISGSVPLMLLSFALLVSALFLLNRGLRQRQSVRYVLTFLAVLCTAAVAALPFASLELPGNKLLPDSFADIDLEPLIVRVFPAFPLVTDLPGYEDPSAAAGLGGRPVLSDVPIFRVKGKPGETLYLRTLTYDTFIWRSWYREHVVLRRQPDMGLFESSGAARPAEAFEVEIEIAADFYSSLPHPLDTGVLLFAEVPRVAEGSLDVGVVVDPPLLRGTRFSIRRAGGTPQDPELPAAAENIYLQIFDSIPEEIRRLAAALERDNEAETIEAIRAYLRSNYGYSLDVPKPPKNQHFLAHFLFELNRGYCVHFATAFTILCRLNGIPARYVTGYLVRLPWQSGAARVTGVQSHAWSEVWLEGRGWSTVEATPAISAAAAGAPAEGEYGGGFDARSLDGLTARQLNALRGGDSGTAALKAPNRMLFTAAGLGALLFIYGILSFVRRQRSSRREKAFLPGSVRALIKLCAKDGIPPPEKIGWIEWKRKLQSTRVDSRRHSEFFVQRVLVVLYRKNGISRRDKKYFRLAASRLRASGADRGSGRL